jgi:hypothetical protein
MLECLEDFSPGEIAAILNTTPQEVERLTSEATAKVGTPACAL